jgi:hypothetical protein
MTKEQYKVLIAKVDKIWVLLMGNGKKGLFEEVRNLKWIYRIAFFISFGLNVAFVLHKLGVFKKFGV